MSAATAIPAPGTKTQVRWLRLALAAVVGLAIYWMPAPHGLAHTAQTVLAITAFTIVLWAAQVMNNAVASVLMMALLIPAGVKPALAMSGFSSPAFWVLLPVLYYGFAMQRTGLAARISYYILSLFPGTYSGILSAFFAIGAVLALGIPSMTVRTAIMAPIAWALIQSLRLPARSKGSALIMLTTIEMAVIPGCGLLYGSLFGPVVVAAFQARNLPLSWLAYAQVLALPTLLLCVLILIVNQKVLKPEAPLDASREFVREKLRALGPLAHGELLTAFVVLLSILFWASDRWHHLPSFFIGMVGMAVFALGGIIRDPDIAGGISWTLLLFMGGIFGLGNVLLEYKITDWLAGYFVPVAQQLTFSTVVLVLVMALAMLAMRFLDPSGFIAIPVLFLPIVGVAIAAGVPPLVLMAPLVLASVPFWVTYQNIWVAMGEGITAGQAFSSGQRLQLANLYAVITLVTLVLAVGYWKVLGIGVMASAPALGFVGFGEAASHIAKGLREAGAGPIHAFDIHAHTPGRGELIQRRAAETGTQLVESNAQLTAACDLIFSTVTSDQAPTAAQQTAPFLTSRHYYADLNSVSPALKQSIAATISPTGARFVEVAVMAPVPPYGHRVPMLLGGEHAAAWMALLAPYGMRIEIAASEIGVAAATKMFRSIVVKGLEALMTECVLGASRYNAADRVFASLAESFPGIDWSKLADYMVGRVVVHGERRAREMEEVAETLQALGIEPIMSEATARRMDWSAALGLKEHFAGKTPRDYREVVRVVEEAERKCRSAGSE